MLFKNNITRVVFIGFTICLSEFTWGQDSKLNNLNKKVNLEDVKIKGEVNKGQSLLSRRNKMNLDERIKVPKNFRKALLENLDPELEGISKLDEKRGQQKQ